MKRLIIYAGCLFLMFAGLAAFGQTVKAADSSGTDDNTYQYTVVSADSEEEAIASLRYQGYEPIIKNIANDSPKLAGEYVYVGYKASTDSMDDTANGSVFSNSVVAMIWAFGLFVGVLVGMFSMKIGRAAKNKGDTK